MTKLKLLSTATIAVLISTSSWATSDSHTADPSAMPMTQGCAGGMMADGQSHKKQMMDMQTMHEMMHQMKAMEHGHDRGHNYGQNQGMGNMMMNPQMMQMRMQHMADMEQSLKNIESLLTELVAQGKSE
jgi:hypothetical protein